MEDEHPSGEWVGYYGYKGKPARCPMHLTLNFGQGIIGGAGIDNNGQFVINGSFDAANAKAKWDKRYVGKHSVQYDGTCRDGEIVGSWSLTSSDQRQNVSLNGEFRIWPLPVEEYRDDESLQSILDREIRRKG
jgi:hypothetical protein